MASVESHRTTITLSGSALTSYWRSVFAAQETTGVKVATAEATATSAAVPQNTSPATVAQTSETPTTTISSIPATFTSNPMQSGGSMDTSIVAPTSSGKSLSTGVIAGIAAGSAVLVLLVFLAFLLFRRHRRARKASDKLFEKGTVTGQAGSGLSRIRSFKGGAEWEKERQANIKKNQMKELSKFDFSGIVSVAAQKPVSQKSWNNGPQDLSKSPKGDPLTKGSPFGQHFASNTGGTASQALVPDSPFKPYQGTLNEETILTPQPYLNPFNDPKGVTKKISPEKQRKSPPALIIPAPTVTDSVRSPNSKDVQTGSVVLDPNVQALSPPPAMPTPPLPNDKVMSDQKVEQRGSIVSSESSGMTEDTNVLDDINRNSVVSSSMKNAVAEQSPSSTPEKNLAESIDDDVKSVEQQSPTSDKSNGRADNSGLLSGRTPSMHAASAKWGKRRAALTGISKGVEPGTGQVPSLPVIDTEIPSSPFEDPLPLEQVPNVLREQVGRQGMNTGVANSGQSPTLSVFRIYDPERSSGIALAYARLNELREESGSK